MRRRLLGTLVASAVVACALAACSTDAGVTATQSQARAPFASEPIPVDPDTRIVVLANGLTVYLRHNDRPGNSAELRLVVNAGSAQETADQAGVAHFLEHMMFNGTVNYPANDLVAVLRGFGMQFGADINAYTSYDETVYELTVPTGSDEQLSTGLEVLSEWLSAATLLQADVTSERGVVHDEWRVREQTFDGRAGVAYDALYLAGSGYDGRAPIGTEAAIEAMATTQLRAFYDTWYRPDNAAVVVVGDIDVDAVEAQVRERFEALQPRAAGAARPTLQVGPFTSPVVDVLADPDTVSMDASLTFPVADQPVADTGELRYRVLVQLAVDMVANRLGDDITRGEAPYRSATSTNEQPVRLIAAPGVALSADIADGAAGLDALAVEFERVRRFGFDDNEVERAVQYYRSGVQSTYDSRDTVSDGAYAADMVDHFLSGAALAPAAFQYRAYTALLDSVTAADVSSAFDEFLATSAPHLLVTVPQSADEQPTEDELLAMLAGVGERQIEPRAPSAAVGDLLMQRPEPVKEVDTSEVQYPDLFVDSTRLVFPNGAVVILNPTDIAADSVAIEARSVGGLAVVPVADMWAARYATGVATHSGVGEVDQVQLETILGGSNVEFSAYIADHFEGFSAASATDDLELVFQLIHLYITAPRFEQTALDNQKDADRPYADDPLADPDFASYDELVRARYGNDPRYQLVPPTSAIDAVDLASVERTFRERFSRPADWALVLSGDFDVTTVTDLARRYIGTLDGVGGTEVPGPVSPAPPAGVVDRTVRSGTGDTASLSLLFTEPSDGTDIEPVLADVLTQVLTNRLTDHIREELGASYSPYAFVSVDSLPETYVQSYVSVSGDPAQMADLAKAVDADIADLAANGPTKDELAAATAAVENDYQLFNDEMVARSLLDHERQPGTLARMRDRLHQLSLVTPKVTALFIARVMPLDHHIQIVQRPA